MYEIIKFSNKSEALNKIENSQSDSLILINEDHIYDFLGINYAIMLQRLINTEHGDKKTDFIVNCANNSALAIKAIKNNFQKIYLNSTPAINAKIANIAKKQNIELINELPKWTIRNSLFQ